jgi:hypothetical protein
MGDVAGETAADGGGILVRLLVTAGVWQPEPPANKIANNPKTTNKYLNFKLFS